MEGENLFLMNHSITVYTEYVVIYYYHATIATMRNATMTYEI